MTLATRYFYPASRAHHAYVMATDFGMKFKTRGGLWTPEGLLHITGAHGYQIEIVEESLELLVPMPGDLIRSVDANCDHLVYRTLKAGEDTGIWQEDWFRIIQRDGKPFMWPESEAV